MWRKRRRVRKLKRAKMKGQYKAECCHCGTAFPFHLLTLDHVVTKSDGGRYTDDNTRLACNDCNQERGTEDFVTFNMRKRAERGLKP